ncbi:MAG: TetR/AcrR family transcriptional regulator, partial [Pseudomonadota bacterium]
SESESKSKSKSESESKTQQRRRLEVARTREDILRAAARAFTSSEAGVVTMRDIAREAGFTAASLYTYFRSKEEIMQGFVKLVSDEYEQPLDEPMPGGFTFAQRLELLLRRQFELVEKRREMLQSIFSFSQLLPHQAACDLLEARVRLLSRWIRRNARPSDLGGCRVDYAARLLVGASIAFMHGWLSSAARRRLVDHAKTIVDFFFHGVGTHTKTRTK